MYFIRAVTPEGCFSIRPVEIREYPLPVVNAGPDKALCNRDSTAQLQVAVSGQTGNALIRWEPVQAGGIADAGSANTLVKPLSVPLEYIVTVSDESGCAYEVRDTVLLTRQPPVVAFAGNDTMAVAGLPHQLTASGGVRYLWTPAAPLNNPTLPDPLAVIQQDSVRFTVTVWDQFDCNGTATILVKTYAGITYYVPNAFSPNGDGLNDVFRPIPVGVIATDLFRIFNRYGELVFETNQWMKGWDGTYRGQQQQPGNYVWMIRGRGRNGKVIEMKGNVVLVR
jgi:gliding motility-associated-like protein